MPDIDALAKRIEDPIVVRRLEAAAIEELSSARAISLFVSTVKRNPELSLCTTESLMNCLAVSVETGLPASQALGQLYLVKFGKEATPIIGYRGDITLAHRTGSVLSVDVDLVYKGEDFTVRGGTAQSLEHYPDPELRKDIANMIAGYVVFTMVGNVKKFVVVYREELDKIKKSSRGAGHASSPWNVWPEEMYKAKVVKRGTKTLPLQRLDPAILQSIQRASEVDAYVDSAMTGGNRATIEDMPTVLTAEVVEEEPDGFMDGVTVASIAKATSIPDLEEMHKSLVDDPREGHEEILIAINKRIGALIDE